MDNIGSVFYTKSEKEGVLNAVWFHPEAGLGTGIAEGKNINGYEGNYVITYFDANGNINAIRDLTIKKENEHYKITWLKNGRETAIGFGFETEKGLCGGWKNIESRK